VSDDENVSYSLARDRSRYGHSDFTYCLAITEEMEFGEPSNYKEAVASSDAAKSQIE
jgi:hypothetical protein